MINKKENKVLLKVLVEKSQKKFVEKSAKLKKVSEAEFVRSIIQSKMTLKK